MYSKTHTVLQHSVTPATFCIMNLAGLLHTTSTTLQVGRPVAHCLRHHVQPQYLNPNQHLSQDNNYVQIHPNSSQQLTHLSSTRRWSQPSTKNPFETLIAFLGFYAVYIGSLLPKVWDKQSFPFPRVTLLRLFGP